MKLSIIIPMYNAEKYIADCLDSILYSDLPKDEYEVIIINDGSTDKGPEIVKDYVAQNENCRYLTQENQGQSVARNYGIREAKGEYIWCIDSDDYTDSKFSGILNFLKEHTTIDILAIQLTKVRENGNSAGLECGQPEVKHNIIMKGRDAVINGYNPSSVCALIIRKTLIEKYNLYFYEGITHQDVELSYRLMAHAGDVIFTDYAPYYYVLHPNSTSQSINPHKKIKYLKDDIVIYNSFRNLAEQFSSDVHLSSVIFNRAQNVLFSMVYSLWIHRKEWKPLGINCAVIDEMKKAGLYPLKGPFDSWKKRMMLPILNIKYLLL